MSRGRRESLREEECLKPKLKNCNRVTTENSFMDDVVLLVKLRLRRKYEVPSRPRAVETSTVAWRGVATERMRNEIVGDGRACDAPGRSVGGRGSQCKRR